MINTKGIVIAEKVAGESDKVVTMLLKDIGKVTIYVRGGRNMKSKLLSATQLFTYSELILSKKNDWYMIDQASIIESFYGLRNSYTAYCYAVYFCEVIDKIILKDSPCNSIILLLLKSLQVLLTEINKKFLCIVFEFKLMSLNGYIATIEHCHICKQVPNAFFFDRYGIVCEKCKSEYSCIKLSRETVLQLQMINQNKLNKIVESIPSEKIISELSSCSSIFMSNLELNFVSKKFIDG